MNDHEILKQVLLSEGCTVHCKYSYTVDTYPCCDKYDDGKCINNSMYEIDYKKVFDDFGIREEDING